MAEIRGLPLTLTVALTTGQHYRAACDRKSYMSFRLVPKSVTLNDLERNSVAFGADYVKVVEDTPILPAVEM